LAVNLNSIIASWSLSSVIRVTVLLWSILRFCGLSVAFRKRFASTDDSSNALVGILSPEVARTASP